MMRYYAIINNVQVGPLTPGELLSLGMKSDTLVWREGMQEWMPAWRLPELDSCFHSVAPGGGMYGGAARNLPSCPPTYLAWSLLVTLACCLVPGFVSVVYSVMVESRYARGDFEGAKSASRAALRWIWVTLGLAVLFIPVMIMLNLFSALLTM